MIKLKLKENKWLEKFPEWLKRHVMVFKEKKERSIATEITNNKLTREKAEWICIHQI